MSGMKRALAIVLPLALLAGGCGESEAHKDARETARIDAQAYCSIVEGLGGYSDEYRRCVNDQTARNLKEWEASHPD